MNISQFFYQWYCQSLNQRCTWGSWSKGLMIAKFVCLINGIVKASAKNTKKEEKPLHPLWTKVSKVKHYRVFGVEPHTLSE